MNTYQPYVYVIGWFHLDCWYVGCRYKRGCNESDLWATYFTSSKYVTAMRYLHGDPDVIRTFPVKDKSEALTRECALMFYLGAIEKTKWLNQSNFIQGMIEGKLPHSQSGLVRQKQSASRRGQKLSPAHIAASAAGRRGQRRSDEWKAEHSKRMKGNGAGVPKPGTSKWKTGRCQRRRKSRPRGGVKPGQCGARPGEWREGVSAHSPAK